MSIRVSERLGRQDELYRAIKDSINKDLRVAAPGIIQSFDATTQTATVQIALREIVRDIDMNEEWLQLPLLLDVPIVLPKAGNFILTMPVTSGDECLVIFGDMCIDAWWNSGGIQNQIEQRRHDLSDAFAIPGIWSQPNKITNYSTTAAQLRTKDGTSYIELKNGEINLVATTVKINGVNFATHKHSGVTTGAGQTGGVV